VDHVFNFQNKFESLPSKVQSITIGKILGILFSYCSSLGKDRTPYK